MADKPSRPRSRFRWRWFVHSAVLELGLAGIPAFPVTLHSLFLVRFLSAEETGGLFDARGAQVATRGPTGRCFSGDSWLCNCDVISCRRLGASGIITAYGQSL